MFLATNYKHSHYFIDSLSIFSNYYRENSSKISENYQKIILNEFPFLKSNDEIENKLKYLIDELNFSSKDKVAIEFFNFRTKCFQNKGDIISFKDKILKLDSSTLRKIPYSVSL